MSWEKYRRQPWHGLAPNPPTEIEATTTTTPPTPTGRVPTPDEDEETMNTKPNFLGITKTPYSFSAMCRSGLFGLSVGTLTGAGFGFMDSMKTVQESKGLKSLSNKGKGSYIMQGVGKQAGGFGAFFGGYHLLKYFGRTYVDPGDVQLIACCSAVGLSAVWYKPQTRQMFPYACMLIAMDSFNELYRDNKL